LVYKTNKLPSVFRKSIDKIVAFWCYHFTK